MNTTKVKNSGKVELSPREGPQLGTASVMLCQDPMDFYEDRQSLVGDGGFYDFSRPVLLLNSGFWPQMLEGRYDRGFYMVRERVR